MITINSVLKYIDIENGERIRIIEINEDDVYAVNIDGVTSMPRKESLSKIKEELEGNKLITVKDPFIRIVQDKELSLVQISKRNEDWRFIEKYWEQNKDIILDKSMRIHAFNMICKESNKGEKIIQ